MAKKKLWPGMLVMALMLGMTVGCGNGNDNSSDNGDINYLDLLNLNTANPSAWQLTSYGLTESQFNTMRNASGDYQGWATEDGHLVLVWIGQNVTNFNNIADVLAGMFTELNRYSDGRMYFAVGFGVGYDLILNISRFSEFGVYIPAGTIRLYI